jgi:hypothetical protein
MGARTLPAIARIGFLAALGLTGCRLLLGIEDPEPIDSLLNDGGLDSPFDTNGVDVLRPDVGPIDSGVDGACVQCGNTACVNTNSDPLNCGVCGNVCTIQPPSTVTCSFGRCLATLAAIPAGILTQPHVSGPYVYFGDTNRQAIDRVPIGGGDVATVVGDAGAGPVAVDTASVYWAYSNRLYAASNEDGGGAGPLTPSFGTVTSVTVDDTALYFASGSTIRQLDIHGGDPQLIATATTTIRSLTKDATNFYFTDYNDSVSSVPRTGGNPLLLASGAAGDVAVFASDLYYTTSSYTVSRIPTVGGTTTAVANYMDRIVIDGAYLYGRGTSSMLGLLRMPLPQGPVNVIGPSGAAPDAIDATSVYWFENSSGFGKIFRLTPK